MAGMSFKTAYWLTFLLILTPVLLVASTVPLSDPLERIRTYTRSMEFDYLSWTIDALIVKLTESSLGTSGYLTSEDQSKTVLKLLDLIHQINQVETQLNEIYADPKIINPESASVALRRELVELRNRQSMMQPIAESVVQAQVNEIVTQFNLTLGGQAIPPVLYHTTPPPDALIISPRNEIRQDFDISITPGMSVDRREKLETTVDKTMNVSSLVVPIAGVGLYPTMVQESTDINWLAEVVAHEWVHNYLFLHPLGISYLNSPELRTMNEALADIAGRELGRAIVERFYPEYLPPPPVPPTNQVPGNNQPPSKPVFDFRAEMHETRVTTDRLLAEGKIDQAESYMEMRRRFLWDNGYQIRKLNQAYFAFYGTYVDQPGGVAGEDPVVKAVYLLREKSPSLADFINQMAWMWKFDQLKRAVGTQ
jgi:hypothetical protein